MRIYYDDQIAIATTIAELVEALGAYPADTPIRATVPTYMHEASPVVVTYADGVIGFLGGDDDV